MTRWPSACDVIAIGRPTFDLQRGHELYRVATGALRHAGLDATAVPDVVTEPEEVGLALRSLHGNRSPADLVVVVQATFTDTRLISAILDHSESELLLWALPEPRTGTPLRLNSLTGLNLAAYHLGRTTRSFRWLYASPEAADVDSLVREALSGSPINPAPLTPSNVRQTLRSGAIGVVGEPPDGFDPCRIDTDSQGVVATDHLPITALFDRARAIPRHEVDERFEQVCGRLVGCDTLERRPVRRSMRLEGALRSLAGEHGWDGVAVRCWPECFSDFGAACCAPIAALTQAGFAASCEADAIGVLTSLVLQDLAGTPAFVADLVDLHADTNTGVLWHCGSAPRSFAAPEAPVEAAVHPNRHLPLVHQFGLAPGPVTIARVSQSRGGLRLVTGSGEVVAGPRPFAGTCGVVRFDQPVGAILDTVMREGLEHHYVVVAGDQTDGLGRFAQDHGLEVIALGARAPAEAPVAQPAGPKT